MQVNDVSNNMKNKQNAYIAFSPLTWLLKIFSLNSNADRSANSSYLLTKCIFTAVVFSTVTFYSLYLKFDIFYADINASVIMTDVVQMIYDVCQYIVDLVFVYKYGRQLSVEYFKQYDSIDQTLGITNSSRIKSRLQKLVIFFTSIWLVNSFCDFGAWVLGYGWLAPIVYSISYVYLYIKILTTLDLTSHVMNIEMRLEIIGNFAHEYYANAERCPGLIGDSMILCNKSWLKAYSGSSDFQSRNNPMKMIQWDDHHEIKWLNRCYLMLTEQVAFINSMYGLRILLNSLSLLIDMVRFTNLGIRIIIGSQRTTYNSGYYPAVSSFLHLLTCIAVIVSLVVHCEQTYNQRIRIIRITDHLLINKNPDTKLRSATKELRELIQDRPISFNMANFFTLNYSLLTSIASVVVTYTIILLQSVK